MGLVSQFFLGQQRLRAKVTYLHGEVEGHELTDGLQTLESGTDGDTGETHFGDGGVDDALRSEFVKESS